MTNTIQVPQHFEPRDYQLEVLKAFDSGVRNFILRWTRQSGKDTMCWAIICRQAVLVPGNYFYIFPTAKQAKKAIWTKIMSDESEGKRLLDMIPASVGEGKSKLDLIVSKNNQEMELTLWNGSTISVVGLDSEPEKIRGITPTGIIFSEFAFSDKVFMGYQSAEPSFRRQGFWQIINSTPNGRNHFYDMWLGAEKDPNWHTSYIQSVWPDKPNFVLLSMFENFEEQYAWFESKVRRGVCTWSDIEREYGGSFDAGVVGSIYGDMLEYAKKEKRIGLFPYDRNYPVCTSWDIGVDDDTTVWFTQRIDGQDRVIDYHEWKEDRSINSYVGLLRSTGFLYEAHFLPHDAENRKHGIEKSESVKDLFEKVAYGFHDFTGTFMSVPKPIKKQHGIEAVRMLFSTLHFNEEACIKGLHHLELYHRKYDKAKGVFTIEPDHDQHSHAADALQTYALALPYLQNTKIPYDDGEQGLARFNVFDD